MVTSVEDKMPIGQSLHKKYSQIHMPHAGILGHLWSSWWNVATDKKHTRKFPKKETA